MGKLNDLINSIYNKFLLRDLFGKVVPGIVLVASFVFPFRNGWADILNIPNVEIPWIIVIGLSWIVGCGIQSIGELVHAINYYKDCSFEKKCENRNKFLEKATQEEKQLLERYVVIKESCGNLGTSLILSILVCASANIMLDTSLARIENILGKINIAGGVSFALVTVFLICGLFRMNKIQQERAEDYMKSIIDKKQDTLLENKDKEVSAEEGR